VDKFLEKMERVEKVYREEDNIPGEFFANLENIRRRLEAAKRKFGSGVILPGELE
jgi:hypothetical protein